MKNELMEQCRREAEEAFLKPGVSGLTREESFGWLDGYAAALYAERSKWPELIGGIMEEIDDFIAEKADDLDRSSNREGVYLRWRAVMGDLRARLTAAIQAKS